MSERPGRVQVEIRCEGEQRARAERLVGELNSPDGRRPPLDIITSGSGGSALPLVVIGPDDEALMLEAVQDGAMGYVVFSSGIEQVREAMAAVSRGEAVIPPLMLGALLRHTVRQQRTLAAAESRLEVLTGREREVLEHLARGRRRTEIAAELFISPETVRTHIQRAMAKLGVHSQTELMALLAPLDRGDR